MSSSTQARQAAFSRLICSSSIGLVYEPEDPVERIQGVGGAEFVFTKTVDFLLVGDISVNNFEVEVGSLDYGFDLDAILGMNWFLRVGPEIDLAQLQLRAPSRPSQNS